MQLTLAVGEVLQNQGFDVEYTRTTDIYESPYQKAMEANEAGVDYFVSIHRNSYPMDNEVLGVESLVYNLSGVKYEMAKNINAQLEKVGFVNLGVQARPNLIVLKRTKMPAVLVEAGFINSDKDNQLFDQSFDDIANAIAEGIKETLMPSDMNQERQYKVQVGAYRQRRYAEELLKELQMQEYPAYIEQGNGFFRVKVGEYSTLEDAVRMERRLKQAGYPTIIVN